MELITNVLTNESYTIIWLLLSFSGNCFYCTTYNRWWIVLSSYLPAWKPGCPSLYNISIIIWRNKTLNLVSSVFTKKMSTKYLYVVCLQPSIVINILFKKLLGLGVRGTALDSFTFFLSGAKSVVIIAEVKDSTEWTFYSCFLK